ncbi:MAG: sensor histidine kinase [Chloroflexi bacterium]|nr:sensor histidine kinase [Chloroflexota bacterium]
MQSGNRNGQSGAYVAFFAVIGISYGIALIGIVLESGWQPSLWKIVVSLVLGVLYSIWGIRSDQLFERYSSPLGTAVLFILPILTVLSVQVLLGANGTWLLSLPIVSIAVEHLRPIWRWPVYIASLLGIALPMWLATGDISQIVGVTLVFSPAVLFVVAFTEARLNEQRAREEAEQLTEQLEKANHQLATYATQVEEMATVHERNRLAREIHDNVGHYLTVVHVQIEAARAVMAQNPEQAQDAMDKAQKLTKEGLTAVRQSVAALRESPTDNQSLIDAIKALAEETRSSGLVVEFVVEGKRRSLDARTKLTLYRMAQEALTNARKHARASRIDLALDYGNPQQVKLTVQDNGVGTAVIDHDGFGLIGMRERVQLLGGSLTIETEPGKGFLLETVVPG